jgi:hypothetical protein
MAHLGATGLGLADIGYPEWFLYNVTGLAAKDRYEFGLLLLGF